MADPPPEPIGWIAGPRMSRGWGHLKISGPWVVVVRAWGPSRFQCSGLIPRVTRLRSSG